MKYILYRAPHGLDKNVRQHELIAVEYGKNIFDVTDSLIRDAADDLAGLPEWHQSPLRVSDVSKNISTKC